MLSAALPSWVAASRHADAEGPRCRRIRTDTGTRVRAVRHLHRPQAPRRRDRARESRAHRKHLSGAPARGSTWWAPQDRDWWIGVLFAVGSFLFGLGTVPGYVNAVGATPDAVTFFIRSAVLHLGRLPAVPRGGRRRTPAAGCPPPEGLRVPARPDRLAGDRRAARGDPRIQHQHLRRHLRRRGHGAGAAPRLAPRRLRIGLLPGRRVAGLVRGVPRLGGLAAELAGLVDHRGQPARFGAFGFSAVASYVTSRDRAAAERPGRPTSVPSSARCASWPARCSCCSSGPKSYPPSRRLRHGCPARQSPPVRYRSRDQFWPVRSFPNR